MPRALPIEHLYWALVVVRGHLEAAGADSNRLLDAFVAEDDYSLERKALHLQARLEGLLRQVQETAIEVRALCKELDRC